MDFPISERFLRHPFPTPIRRPNWFCLLATPTRLAAVRPPSAAACLRTAAASDGSLQQQPGVAGMLSVLIPHPALHCTVRDTVTWEETLPGIRSGDDDDVVASAGPRAVAASASALSRRTPLRANYRQCGTFSGFRQRLAHQARKVRKAGITDTQQGIRCERERRTASSRPFSALRTNRIRAVHR